MDRVYITRSRRQDGFVLILVVLSMLAILGTVLLVGIAGSTANRERQNIVNSNTSDALQRAKDALIGYLVSPPSSTFRPGVLPIPNALIGSSSYSGLESSGCIDVTGASSPPYALANAKSTNKRCVGKIPWATLGVALGSPDTFDSTGAVPWVAVSANLVSYDNCLMVLNSDVANLSSPATPSCPTLSVPYPQPTQLPHPWLTVRDASGSILSDKVAIVLILPGPPLTTETRTQNRSPASPGGHADYLDSIRLPLGCTTSCTTYDNADLTNQFVQIAPGALYPPNAQDASKRGQPIPFNDLLIFLTIDEVMYYIERRVLGEMSAAIRASVQATGSYPWAATFATPSSAAPFVSSVDAIAAKGRITGLFPFYPQPPLSNVPFPNPSRVPNYSTNFDWVIVSFQPKTINRNCAQVQTAPNRWADLNQFVSVPDPQLLSGSASGTSQWRGKNTLEFQGATVASPTLVSTKSYTLFSSAANCNAGAPVAPAPNIGTYQVTRSISFSVDSECATNAVTVTYSPATSTKTQRFNWSCRTLSNPPSFGMEFTDAIASPIARMTGPITIVPKTSAPADNVTVANLRFQPVMPSWFYDQLWYQTAFFALSRNQMPIGGNTDDCVGQPNLSVDGVSVVGSVALLAGRRLASQASRPSPAISDYLDLANAAFANSCVLNSGTTRQASTANDNILSVTP